MEHYKYFSNRACEFYPCHQTDKLNCLFCYCPLYFLDCGGCFTLTEQGLKDCSHCLIPHSDDGYDTIVRKLMEAAEVIKARQSVQTPACDKAVEPIVPTE